MPNAQPAQLANLQPPWRRETAPRGERARRSSDVDKALRIARKGCPEAMLYAIRVLNDPEEPTRLRLKAAEIIIDAGMPKNPEAAQIAGGGAEWLEIRFVTPGQAAAAPETHRITFDPATDVEGNEPSDVG